MIYVIIVQPYKAHNYLNNSNNYKKFKMYCLVSMNMIPHV